MELKITDQKNNELFKRKEIFGVIKSESSPSREQVLDALAEKLSVSIEQIKIKGIHGSFGVQEFKLEANIYNSKEDKEAIEVKKKKDEELEKKKAESEKPTEQSAPESSESQKQGASDQPAQEAAEEKQEQKTSDEEKAQPEQEPSGKPEENKEEQSSEKSEEEK